jgi:hypothetical protein
MKKGHPVDISTTDGHKLKLGLSHARLKRTGKLGTLKFSECTSPSKETYVSKKRLIH